MQIQRYSSCSQIELTKLKDLAIQTQHIDIKLQQLQYLKLTQLQGIITLINLMHDKPPLLPAESKQAKAVELASALKLDFRSLFKSSLEVTERYQVAIGYLQLVAANISGSVSGSGSGSFFSERQHYQLIHVAPEDNLPQVPRFPWNHDSSNYCRIRPEMISQDLSRTTNYHLSLTNGDVYQGKIINGRLTEGCYYYQNGDIYRGSIFNNFRHGLGEFYKGDGSYCYRGQFNQDNFHGFGVLYAASGNRYEGEFVDNFRQGQGTLYFANGRKLTTTWHKDQSVPIAEPNIDELVQARRKNSV